jgi:dTDP-4-amino-4,6-dideoxygalactose transaminase
VQAPVAAVRDRARNILSNAGIATDIHYPIPDNRQYALAQPIRTTTVPNAENACSTIFSVPLYPELVESEIDRVCEGLTRLAESQL